MTDTFAAWSARHGFTGLDPDGDGIEYLIVFGPGLDQQQSSTQGLPTLSQGTGQHGFRFARPKNLTALTDTVQTSRDLHDWSGTVPTVVGSSVTTTETFIARLPKGQAKLRVRL